MNQEKMIIYPITTEKALQGESTGKYTFKVAPFANKIEVTKAVEKIFDTKVENIRILNTAKKIRRRGKTVGEVSGYKKAIVTLVAGKKIKIREEKKADKKTKKQDNKEVEEKQ